MNEIWLATRLRAVLADRSMHPSGVQYSYARIFQEGGYWSLARSVTAPNIVTCVI